MKTTFFFSSFLIFWLAYYACKSDIAFEKKIQFSNTNWAYSDTLHFDLIIQDTTSQYDILLDIDHTLAYPFENLYMQVHTLFPTRERTVDLLPIQFADNYGDWYGKCQGDRCLLRVYLQEAISFKSAGNYRISFEQFSRKDSLEGIQAMTLQLKKLPPQ